MMKLWVLLLLLLCIPACTLHEQSYLIWEADQVQATDDARWRIDLRERTWKPGVDPKRAEWHYFRHGAVAGVLHCRPVSADVAHCTEAQQ